MQSHCTFRFIASLQLSNSLCEVGRELTKNSFDDSIVNPCLPERRKGKKENLRTLESNQVQGHFPQGAFSRSFLKDLGQWGGSRFRECFVARRGANGVLEFSQTMGQSRLGNFGESESRQSRRYDGEVRTTAMNRTAANWLLRLTY